MPYGRAAFARECTPGCICSYRRTFPRWYAIQLGQRGDAANTVRSVSRHTIPLGSGPLRAAALAFAVLWQIAPVTGTGSQAPQASGPQHLLYERVLQLPSSVSGQACAALDEDVLAHTASSSLTDLRLYASHAGAKDVETPFAFLESGRSSADTQQATLGTVAVHDGVIAFDLAMPSRPYSEVDLDLNAKNFVGMARVASYDAHRAAVSLGSFPVFDLSERGLARSTSIRLPQTRAADLHIELRLSDLHGNPLPNLSSDTVQGATVPAGRLDQTKYTTITSAPMQQQAHSSFASFIVPAHVPVERVRFVLGAQSPSEFLREVTITANPVENGREALGAAEGVSGHIFRVSEIPGLSNVAPVDSERLYMDTALGANLRSPANISVTVDNDSSAPLAISAVQLQMRTRTICFNAHPSTTYTLRYGAPDLSAPDYGFARHFTAAASPIMAVLGPEKANTHFAPRTSRPDERQQTQLFWVILLAVFSVGGVLALQYVRHKHEETR